MFDAPNARSSALLTIDVQYDFSLPGASACIEGTEELLPAMAEVLEAFRAARRPVVHVVRLYHPDGSNAELCRKALIGSGTRIVAPGTHGSQLRAELQPDPARPVELDHAALLKGAFQQLGENEWVMFKPRWGAFYATGLAEHLAALGVDTVAVIGANFPNCPRTTVYEAGERDLRIVLVPDAVSRVYPRGLEELAGIGVELIGARDIGPWLREDRPRPSAA